MEETLVNLIQTLGFPIAIAAAMMWYTSKITTRNMDEAKERESNYQKILVDYGARMTQMSEVLSLMNKNLADARIEHKGIMEFIAEESNKQAEK